MLLYLISREDYATQPHLINDEKIIFCLLTKVAATWFRNSERYKESIYVRLWNSFLKNSLFIFGLLCEKTLFCSDRCDTLHATSLRECHRSRRKTSMSYLLCRLGYLSPVLQGTRIATFLHFYFTALQIFLLILRTALIDIKLGQTFSK